MFNVAEKIKCIYTQQRKPNVIQNALILALQGLEMLYSFCTPSINNSACLARDRYSVSIRCAEPNCRLRAVLIYRQEVTVS